jgi:hypothetical protein
MRTAKLIAIPSVDRVDLECGDGSRPTLGDIVELDQGFTFPDGRSGGIVFCKSSDGKTKWCADVYDSEIEVIG